MSEVAEPQTEQVEGGAATQDWPVNRVWLPEGVVALAAVSPELENVEGAWWVRSEAHDGRVEKLEEALRAFSNDDSPDGKPCWCDFDGGGGEFIPEDYHQDDCLAARRVLEVEGK